MNGNSYAYNRGDPEFVVRMGTVRETKKPHPCDDSHSGATIAETRRPSRATIYSPYLRAPSTAGQGGGSDSIDISQMAQDHERNLTAHPFTTIVQVSRKLGNGKQCRCANTPMASSRRSSA